jgi:23S rRNA pseudouridine2605 synthase
MWTSLMMSDNDEDSVMRDLDARADSDRETGRDTESRSATPELVRLQKVLSGAGVASRRKAEELIRQGRVRVDGVVVRDMGVKIDPDAAIVHVDGNRVQLRADLEYLALNKMPGMLSTMSDDEGRPTIGDMLEDWGISTRLYHVGRLDIDSEGLLLLTNDGELAHRLTHPSYGVPKTYMAEIPGPVPRELGRLLTRGIDLEDGPVKVDSLDVVDVLGGRAVVKVVLHEGRKRLVRRMLEAAGHPVSRLVRTQIGELQLGHQRPGTVRRLNPVEVAKLYRAVGL